jgi:hypothetical protein
MASHLMCDFWVVECAKPRRENHPRPLLRKEGRLNPRRHHVARYASKWQRTSPLLTKEGPGVVLTRHTSRLTKVKSHT